MTLTKENLIQALHNHHGFTIHKSIDLVESLLEIIKSTLASGEDVLISGFGKFCVRDKKERKGRNLQTGEDKMLRARRVVVFKCSGRLREKVGGEKGNKI